MQKLNWTVCSERVRWLVGGGDNLVTAVRQVLRAIRPVVQLG